MELQDLFVKGEYFPLTDHERRMEKYRRNDKLANGDHADVFLNDRDKNKLYLSANFPGLIARKSSDFLFGEKPIISSGKEESSNEQKALDRITEDNVLPRVFYQQALQSAIKGDAFIKIRFGQSYGGAFPESYDPKRVLIEGVDAKKVYPQTSPFDKSKIVAYHIAEAIQVNPSDDVYELYVESHYAGKIVYRRFKMNTFLSDRDGHIRQWKISDEIAAGYEEVKTGVPVPLVVHIPNYTDGTTWQGQDDLSEHVALFDEINNRMSQIGNILDKHADPSLILPAGLLQQDPESGETFFHVAVNKVFEVMGKEDVPPSYLTWDGKLEHAYKELETLIEFLLSTSEIPAVAIGLKDSGTSGNSGLSIKWRMAGLLAKINRKRQFFEDGIKRVYMIAQMLEMYAQPDKVDYELTVPIVTTRDGLPTDETETANRMMVRTNGAQTLSRKTALMVMDGLTEEQAEAEIKRIDEEREQAFEVANASIFNDELEVRKTDNRMTNAKEDEKGTKDE